MVRGNILAIHVHRSMKPLIKIQLTVGSDESACLDFVLLTQYIEEHDHGINICLPRLWINFVITVLFFSLLICL